MENPRAPERTRWLAAVLVGLVALTTLLSAVAMMSESGASSVTGVTENGRTFEETGYALTLEASRYGPEADEQLGAATSVQVEEVEVRTEREVTRVRVMDQSGRVLGLLPLALASVVVLLVTRSWAHRRPPGRGIEALLVALAAALAAAAVVAPRLLVRAREVFVERVGLPDCLEPDSTYCFPPPRAAETDLLLLAAAVVVVVAAFALRDARRLRRDVDGLV